MSIFQLVYLSFASDSINADPLKETDRILEVAYKNNPKRDITGMLLFKGGAFLQLIEGPTKNVKELFEKISIDCRHKISKVLIQQEVKQRLFSDWSMAYREVSVLDLDIIVETLPWQKLMDASDQSIVISNEDILDIFCKFRYKLQGSLVKA